MNIKSKLTLVLSLIAVPLALPATSPERAYLEYYRNNNAEPVPTSIVMPKVDSEFAGTDITLEFVVDSAGKPQHITSATPDADPRLVVPVTEALARWKFIPAYRNGQPVARKVELPVSVVAPSRAG